MAKGTKKELSPEQRKELLKILKARFEKNSNRHKDPLFSNVSMNKAQRIVQS